MAQLLVSFLAAKPAAGGGAADFAESARWMLAGKVAVASAPFLAGFTIRVEMEHGIPAMRSTTGLKGCPRSSRRRRSLAWEKRSDLDFFLKTYRIF